MIKPVPPKDLVDWVGGGDFLATGEKHCQLMVELANLKSTHNVLDVGCGCGRTAVALLDFLETSGSYDGFDASLRSIRWCHRNIGKPSRQFRFLYLDVFNGLYNPSGSERPESLGFPYEDKAFDLVCLWSIFTHMFRDGIRHYLSEIHRVLKSNGKCLLTAFLLNDESKELVDSGKADLPIKYPFGSAIVAYEDNPEGAVGYEPDVLSQWIAEAGFEVFSGWHLGSWCGRENSDRVLSDYQDIIVLIKR